MTAALEGGEWAAARPDRTLPPGKTRYPFYRRLCEPQGWSVRAENLVPPGFFFVLYCSILCNIALVHSLEIITKKLTAPYAEFTLILNLSDRAVERQHIPLPYRHLSDLTLFTVQRMFTIRAWHTTQMNVNCTNY